MIRTYLHPLPLRVWHWINAFLVITLIATGLYLRLHGIAALRPHDRVLFWHRIAGLALISSTLFWFIRNISSADMRQHYAIRPGDLRGISAQLRYYLFSIFRGGKDPFRASEDNRYNTLQKLAYDAVMFLFIPLQALTGLLFTDIPALRRYLIAQDLVGLIGFIHVLFAYLVVVFLIVHLYMTTTGETVFSHTKAMITGYEERADGIDEGHERYEKEMK